MRRSWDEERRGDPIRVAPPTKTFGDSRHSNQWGRGAKAQRGREKLDTD